MVYTESAVLKLPLFDYTQNVINETLKLFRVIIYDRLVRNLCKEIFGI